MSNFLASNLTLKRLVFIALAIVSLSITIDLLSAWGDQKLFKDQRINSIPPLKAAGYTDSIPSKSGSATQLNDVDTATLSHND
ncbi:MAG: hypothetical protein LBE37_16945 [Sphingobacterium sp.]|jgi:hypothetical protein|nr:hypothetical protein [Sphingobacterium sp.]